MESRHNISAPKGSASSSRPHSPALPAPGTVVMASVDEDLGDGRYSLKWGSNRMAVNSRSPLKPGQSLILRSELSPEGKLTLVVQGQALPDKHAAGKIIYGPGRQNPRAPQNAQGGGSARTTAQTGVQTNTQANAQTSLESVQDDPAGQTNANGYGPQAKNGQEAGNQMAAGVARAAPAPVQPRQPASSLVGLVLEPLPDLEASVPLLETAVEEEKAKLGEKTKQQTEKPPAKSESGAAETNADADADVDVDASADADAEADAPDAPAKDRRPQTRPAPETPQQRPGQDQQTSTTPPATEQSGKPRPQQPGTTQQSDATRQPAPPAPSSPSTASEAPPEPAPEQKPPPEAKDPKPLPASPAPDAKPVSAPEPAPVPASPAKPSAAQPPIRPDILQKEALTQMVKAAELPLAEEAQKPVLGTGGTMPGAVIDKAATIFLRAAGLTPDDATLEAARALVRNNVQIDRQTIQALMAIAANVPEGDKDAAVKAAARLAAKDIPIAQPLVSGLADVMSRTAGPAELMRRAMESLALDDPDMGVNVPRAAAAAATATATVSAAPVRIPPETRTLMQGARDLLALLHVDLGQSDAASALERYVSTFGRETMAKALTLVEVSAQAVLENNPALQTIDRALTKILTLLEDDIAAHEQTEIAKQPAQQNTGKATQQQPTPQPAQTAQTTRTTPATPAPVPVVPTPPTPSGVPAAPITAETPRPLPAQIPPRTRIPPDPDAPPPQGRPTLPIPEQPQPKAPGSGQPPMPAEAPPTPIPVETPAPARTPPLRSSVNAYANAPRALPLAEMLKNLPPMPKLVSITDPIGPRQIPPTPGTATPIPAVILPEPVAPTFAQHLSSAQQAQPHIPRMPPSMQPIPEPTQSEQPASQIQSSQSTQPGVPVQPVSSPAPVAPAPLPASLPAPAPASQQNIPQASRPEPAPAVPPPAPQTPPQTPQLPAAPQATPQTPAAQQQQPAVPRQPAEAQQSQQSAGSQPQQSAFPQPGVQTQPKPEIPQGMQFREQSGSSILMKLDSLFQTPGLNKAEFDLLRPDGFLDRFFGASGTTAASNANAHRVHSEAGQLFRQLTSQNSDVAERALQELPEKDPETLKETAARLTRQEAETMRSDPILNKLSDAASTLRDLGRQALAVKAENVAGQERNPGVMFAEVPFKLNDDAGDGRMQMFYRKAKGKQDSWSSRVILDLNTTRMGPVLGDLRFFGQDMTVNMFVEHQELADYLETEAEALIDNLWAKGFKVKTRFMVLPTPAQTAPALPSAHPDITGESLPVSHSDTTIHRLDIKG